MSAPALVEEKIKVSDSGKMSFRQEVVRKAMVPSSGREVQVASHPACRAIEQYCSRSAATCCDW